MINGRYRLKIASIKGLGMVGVKTFVGNCVGNNEKGFQSKSPETLVFPFAPPTEQFSNQLFEDLKKLYDLQPFINVDHKVVSPGGYLSSPK